MGYTELAFGYQLCRGKWNSLNFTIRKYLEYEKLHIIIMNVGWNVGAFHATQQKNNKLLCFRLFKYIFKSYDYTVTKLVLTLKITLICK